LKKQLGPFSFVIDRPKGHVKEWPQPDGSVKRFVYPCDYGYWPKIKGEDGEGLDAFVGDDPKGHKESFQKLNPDGTPDETKFLLGVTDRQREAIYGLYKTEVNARRVYDDWDDVQTALDEYKGKLHKTAGHAHRWSYGYLPGTGYRHCACGEIEEVFPSGPPKSMAEKEKGFVRRHLEKSAAYLFGEKLAMDPFASMNWVPSNFAGRVQSPGQIMQASQVTPALAGTQENIRMLQLAQDPFTGAMPGSPTPGASHHRHRRHHR
jgi:hypothetical protein